ncbi:MAG: hypothetical protein U0325_04815 [Polyangiales bacterium]
MSESRRDRRWRVGFGGSLLLAAIGCGAQADEDYGTSAQVVSDLTVGGHYCPQRGEIAGRNLPPDNVYYITTFGIGPDNGPMACGGTANGTWLYLADSWRFGCGARVKMTNPRNGRWCVAQVADVGPNICVERAAGRPIIDASPAATQEMYGRRAIGWSDRVPVHVERVGNTTPLGCGGPSDSTAPPSATNPTRCYSGTLGREVDSLTCLQSRLDNVWYQCVSGSWRRDDNIPSSRRGPGGACSPFIARGDHQANTSSSMPVARCFSMTYNREMTGPACVQSRFDNLWYQCTNIGWVNDRGIASSRTGPSGACSQYLPL